MTKKISAFLFAVLILYTGLLSCSDDGNNNMTESTSDTTNLPEAETEPERILPDLEACDFAGYEFTFIGTNGMSGIYYISDDITAESENGEPINDALYSRILEVEDTYGITVKSKLADDINSEVNKSIRADENAYQGVWAWQSQVCIFATSNYLQNLYNVPSLNPDNSWWDPKEIEAFSMGNRLYFIVGELNITAKKDTYGVLFNKVLFEDFALNNPYDLVYENQWTIDRYIEMVKKCSNDIDGDGQWTSKDMYGFVGQPRDLYTYMVGCGISIVSKNEDDFLEYSLYNDRSVTVYNKIAEIMFDDTLMINPGRVVNEYGGDGLAVWRASREEWFAGDRILFYVAGINSVTELRNMESPFGVLPMPKFDESQTEYRHFLTEYCTVIGIPVTNTDLDEAGYTLEAMAAISCNELKTAFYDTLLKRKVLRDDESEGMLDIIFKSRSYDPAMMYNIGGYLNMFINLGTNKSYDFASAYAKSEKSALSALDKLNNIYKAME